ncbi:hypothetical protein CDEST_06652 [Colletotrichum destructivum]|uniref:DUF7918 domain-containing protein n=1 Tax=Colletotrichum destructivum TaxID=34406 RepID=A0AAX4IFR5_9PEZI|nr:hypothetical protein CDEST_06652 [Colletotrichum destructivum]
MAVIDSLPEVDISIRINGSETGCAEYDDCYPPHKPAGAGPATHKISKIIESQDNAVFKVHYEIRNARQWIVGTRGLSVKSYIDGNMVSHRCLLEHHIQDEAARGCVEEVITNSTNSGMAMLKLFSFAAIKKMEECGARVNEDRNLAEHLGNIEIVISLSKVLRQIPLKPFTVNTETEFAEKALKGKDLTHCTSFLDDREVFKCPILEVDNLGAPLARFTFRYRSRAILQAEGIIPRDPSPEPLHKPQTQSIADLPLSEIRRLAQERLDQLDEATVKREDEATVKREAEEDNNPRPRKVYKKDKYETIDLTGS